jgi:hypothetical protein
MLLHQAASSPTGGSSRRRRKHRSRCGHESAVQSFAEEQRSRLELLRCHDGCGFHAQSLQGGDAAIICAFRDQLGDPGLQPETNAQYLRWNTAPIGARVLDNVGRMVSSQGESISQTRYCDSQLGRGEFRNSLKCRPCSRPCTISHP